MKIRMKSTQKGAIDGIHVAEYLAGEEYDLSASKGARELAQAFVAARMAVEVREHGDEIPGIAVEVEQIGRGEQIDAQGLEPAIETQAIAAAPANRVKRPYNRK